MTALRLVPDCRRRACASCQRVRPIITRGLCSTCRHRFEWDGTITDWGYVKADRLEDYAWLRASGESLPVAAARLGVTERTGWRYEAQLTRAGRAPWRVGWPVERLTAPVAPDRAEPTRSAA